MMKINTIFTGTIASCLFAVTTLMAAEAVEWSYHEQEEWGAIHDPSQTVAPHMYPYAVCGLGQHQSPVDLASANPSRLLNKLKIRYPADTVNFYNSGHGVQVNFSEGYQGQLLIGGEAYPLIQFHFHEPSEHVIGDRTFPAELHFVHVRDDGKIAVLGVLIEIGQENEVFQTVLDNTPYTGKDSNQNPSASINPVLLLPRDKRHFYTLAGSLTTPPCSEGVNWYVLANPITISEAQLAQLKSFYSDNARLPQDLNNRVVAETP